MGQIIATMCAVEREASNINFLTSLSQGSMSNDRPKMAGRFELTTSTYHRVHTSMNSNRYYRGGDATQNCGSPGGVHLKPESTDPTEIGIHHRTVAHQGEST